MIGAPYTYCIHDEPLVAAFELLVPEMQLGHYWSDSALDNLRSRVKDFYITAQHTICCYCNRHLGTSNHRMWDVEHIAARSKHPRFMFKPTNLAVSCPDCNIRKGEQEVLVNSRRKTYPKTADGFRIVHAHFDTFEEHIYHVDMVYLPKTEKGKNTIYICDLLRFAQEYIDWPNSAADTSFEKEIDIVFDEGRSGSHQAIDAIIAKLPIK